MGDYEGNNVMSHMVRDMDQDQLNDLLNPDPKKKAMDDLKYFQNKRDGLLKALETVNKQLDAMFEATIVYRLTQKRSE